jgi:hypothetical protein
MGVANHDGLAALQNVIWTNSHWTGRCIPVASTALIFRGRAARGVVETFNGKSSW